MTQPLPATQSRSRGYRQSRLDPVSSALAVGSVEMLWIKWTGPPLTRPRGFQRKA